MVQAPKGLPFIGTQTADLLLFSFSQPGMHAARQHGIYNKGRASKGSHRQHVGFGGHVGVEPLPGGLRVHAADAAPAEADAALLHPRHDRIPLPQQLPLSFRFVLPAGRHKLRGLRSRFDNGCASFQCPASCTKARRCRKMAPSPAQVNRNPREGACKTSSDAQLPVWPATHHSCVMSTFCSGRSRCPMELYAGLQSKSWGIWGAVVLRVCNSF